MQKEAKDPSTGSVYYYNEETGKTQWESPCEIAPVSQSLPSTHLPQDWLEGLDETSGMISDDRMLSYVVIEFPRCYLHLKI